VGGPAVTGALPATRSCPRVTLEKRSDIDDEIIFSNCLVGNCTEGEDSLMVGGVLGTVVKSKSYC
jgi:hypothetical protein